LCPATAFGALRTAAGPETAAVPMRHDDLPAARGGPGGRAATEKAPKLLLVRGFKGFANQSLTG